MGNLLSDTVAFIVPFARYQAANIGTSNMPIIGIANIVRNIIFSSPLTWRFNRNTVNLTGPVVAGTQDYTQNISDFGFLEASSVNDGTKTFQIDDVMNTEALAASVSQARPKIRSIFMDDGIVTLTFRFS